MNFWEWLVHNQLISGDPNYYASGQAGVDERAHALRVAIDNLAGASAPNARSDFYTRLQQAGGFEGDPNYYASGQAGTDEIANLVSVASGRALSQGTPVTSAPQVPAPGPHPAEPGAPPAPVVGTATGVLAGGKTFRVQQADGTYRWYQAYEFPPGSSKYAVYQYNNVQQVEAALGEIPEFLSLSQGWFEAMAPLGVVGAAEEVIGMAGNWGTFSQQIMQESAQKAGISDPTLIGKMWSDPQIQQIAVQAAVGNWTPEQILAEQRKTNFWTNVLYPGITAFYGRTTEPEKAWSNYVGNVSPALTALGYKKDADGTFNSQIKKMLDNGVDDQIFLENVPIFQQAAQNQAFFDVYRQRAQQELGKDVTFGDWFNVIKGEASPDLMKVAEGATVAYAGQQAGYGLQEDMLQRLINERDLSEQEARNIFSEVNQAVLALGDTGLARGGLTRDDILSAAAGIAPSSGMNTDEVKQKVAKIVQEADLFDEQKVGFYLGFDPSGRPQRPGLQAIRGGESA